MPELPSSAGPDDGNAEARGIGRVGSGDRHPMPARKMGVEEELMLVDPASGRLRAVASAALAAHRARMSPETDDQEQFGADAGLGVELFQQQIETGTTPCRTPDELAGELVRCRREAAASAARASATIVAVANQRMPRAFISRMNSGAYRPMMDEIAFGRASSIARHCPSKSGSTPSAALSRTSGPH